MYIVYYIRFSGYTLEDRCTMTLEFDSQTKARFPLANGSGDQRVGWNIGCKIFANSRTYVGWK